MLDRIYKKLGQPVNGIYLPSKLALMHRCFQADPGFISDAETPLRQPIKSHRPVKRKNKAAYRN